MRKEITDSLKVARKALGYSQLDLSSRTSLPQSQISKIENGGVDIRISTLVQLAESLDLDVMLVPRKASPSDQPIARNSKSTSIKLPLSAVKDFSKLQKLATRVAKAHPNRTEAIEIARLVQELRYYRLPPNDIATIRLVDETLNAVESGENGTNTLKDALSRLQTLRLALD